MSTIPQAYVQEANQLVDRAISLLDEADNSVKKGNFSSHMNHKRTLGYTAAAVLGVAASLYLTQSNIITTPIGLIKSIYSSEQPKNRTLNEQANYEVPIGPEYISHEDILSQEKIEPDFKRLDPKPNEYSKTGVSKDRGARAFCDQFRGMPYPLIFSKKGKLRTGQKALDIIVSSGLATSEEAKGVLAYLVNHGGTLDRKDCFGDTRFHTLMNGQGKANYKVGH